MFGPVCPLWVKSGLSSQHQSMTALPLKAEFSNTFSCPLSATIGNQNRQEREDLTGVSWHERERLSWLELARRIRCKGLAARYCEFFH